jgi:ketosteroid isomerase-like protein
MSADSPDKAWWEQLFAAIDARDAVAFSARLTADADFRFGNMPVVSGTAAITAAVGGFFSSVAGCRHALLRTWVDDTTVACEGSVTYTRHDGTAVTVPFANVFELSGRLIRSYRIYIDNSPLTAA